MHAIPVSVTASSVSVARTTVISSPSRNRGWAGSCGAPGPWGSRSAGELAADQLDGQGERRALGGRELVALAGVGGDLPVERGESGAGGRRRPGEDGLGRRAGLRPERVRLAGA